MAVGLVGSVGAFTLSSSPAYGQTPTAGNLLICWAWNTGASGVPALPATSTPGWATAASQLTGVTSVASLSLAIFYKIAAGGDAAPTITGNSVACQAAEFSGCAASSPADQSGGVNGLTTPQVATSAGVDATAGELVIALMGAGYSTTAVRTFTMALNNGATAVTAENSGGGSVTNLWGSCYGITSSKAAADTATFTLSTVSKIVEITSLVASFKVFTAAPAALLPQQHHRRPEAAQARRSPGPSRGSF